MSLRSRQILADPGLRAALDADEQPREYVSLSPTGAQGARRDGPVGTGPSRPPREGAGRTVAALLWGDWMPRWARGDLFERMAGGVARQGRPDSLGTALDAAAQRAGGLVVTSRRLLAVSAGRRTFADDPDQPGRRVVRTAYTVTWAAPLTELDRARRAPRLNGRGRVELTFRDRSGCAVVTGVLTTGAAKRLLAALATP